jgi:hypothetical protein
MGELQLFKSQYLLEVESSHVSRIIYITSPTLYILWHLTSTAQCILRFSQEHCRQRLALSLACSQTVTETLAKTPMYAVTITCYGATH